MSTSLFPRSLATGLGLVLALSMAGCATSEVVGDKAGAGEPPVTLTLGSPDSESTPGAEALKHFADEVSRRSEGRISIRLEWNAAGSQGDVEAAAINQVLDGDLDLGWVGTRAWDGQGVRGFSALQAPFLINDYALLNRVLGSELAGAMLSELKGIGLTGLAVIPDQLRHPLGFREPFLTLDDFQGAELRVPSSRISEAIVRSLGATPVNLNGADLGAALDSGELAGAETSAGNLRSLPQGGYLTMNLTFYPKVQTLFAATDRFGALTEATRSILQAAASETLAYVLAEDPEGADIKAFCDLGGTLVNAEPAEVSRIAAATDPVREEMETDPIVRDYIKKIEALRTATEPSSLAECPT
jgi:TRAP-type C4-dicarboxylate transport system substrate-binding protein